MSKERFDALIKELRSHAGFDNDPTFMRDGLMEIHGLPVCLEYLEDWDECQLQVDLGRPANVLPALLYPKLLADSFDARKLGVPFYSVHEQTEHVIAAQSILLYEVENGAQLFDLLVSLVEETRLDWEDICAGPSTALDDEASAVGLTGHLA
jgi:hypothetical protein